MKKKILVIGYNPPPYHGVVQMMRIPLTSEILNQEFIIKFFSLVATLEAKNRGKFSFENIFLTLKNFLKFIWIVITFRPNIVYMSCAHNKFGFIRDSFFILVGKFFNAKICVHFHAGDFDKSYALKSDMFKRYIKFVYSKIDRLIVLANKFVKQFQGLIDEKYISVLYNCTTVELKDFVKIKNNKKIKILFMGYLSRAKGVVEIVKAAKVVLSKFDDVEFVLCGQPVDIEPNVIYITNPNGGYTEMKKFVTDNGLEENIKEVGYVTGLQKERLFKESDIFVFPSYSEGFPITVLEAMSYKLPLIVSRVGALDEMLEFSKNALFIDEGDYFGLANAIIRLIEDVALSKNMGENNFNLVKNKYNKEIYAKNLFEILNKL